MICDWVTDMMREMMGNWESSTLIDAMIDDDAIGKCWGKR